MPRITKSSRRAAPLKDEDYDHEISLVDNAPEEVLEDARSAPEDVLEDARSAPEDTLETRSDNPPRISITHSTDETGDGAADSEGNTAAGEQTESRRPSARAALSPPGDTSLSPALSANSTTPLLDSPLSVPPIAVAGPSRSRSSSRGRQHRRYGSTSNGDAAPLDKTPTAQVQGVDAQPIAQQPKRQSMPSTQPTHPTQPIRREPESALDVLYENERGLFLCGIPLFSRQALGNLDPSPWTNAAQRSSPTDIYTAQVPDPTWEWAWPEWRLYHDDDADADADGWQYSFMFAKLFSWHGPSWYRSFVRRRAWIRKRVKRTSAAQVSLAAASLGLGKIDSIADPTLLNPDYFTVVSAATMRRSSSRARSRSRSRSRVGSRSSLAVPGASQGSMSCIYKTGSSSSRPVGGDPADDGDFVEMPKTVVDADVLMQILRAARIDREKIEAVDNYIQNAGDDLVRLQDCMHEIMALFVFQASRRVLLTLLTEAHDAAVEARQADKDIEKNPAAAAKRQALDRRMEYLTAAAKHADEEVRRLEYWSDIKAMAKQGATPGAVDQTEGWEATKWQGVDQSGPEPPPNKS